MHHGDRHNWRRGSGSAIDPSSKTGGQREFRCERCLDRHLSQYFEFHDLGGMENTSPTPKAQPSFKSGGNRGETR